MIQYTLKCSKNHRFDSWFQSADAFDKLKAAGMVVCAVCGDTHVEKAIMAPRVRPARNAAASKPEETPKSSDLSTPANETEAALRKLREQVEANSDYVGKDFATEARAIHTGERPERAIYGEAKPDEARELIEDGVPVLPLPFRSGPKSN